MVIFHGYVSLPEGNYQEAQLTNIQQTADVHNSWSVDWVKGIASDNSAPISTVVSSWLPFRMFTSMYVLWKFSPFFFPMPCIQQLVALNLRINPLPPSLVSTWKSHRPSAVVGNKACSSTSTVSGKLSRWSRSNSRHPSPGSESHAASRVPEFRASECSKKKQATLPCLPGYGLKIGYTKFRQVIIIFFRMKWPNGHMATCTTLLIRSLSYSLIFVISQLNTSVKISLWQPLFPMNDIHIISKRLVRCIPIAFQFIVPMKYSVPNRLFPLPFSTQTWQAGNSPKPNGASDGKII